MGKGLIGDCYDIFNVHRAFMFSNFQFIDIEGSKFSAELRKNKFLGKDFIAQYLSSAQFDPHFDFQPDYLVDDNIFEVFNYFFKISHYVYEMKRSSMIKPTLYQGSNIEILKKIRILVCSILAIKVIFAFFNSAIYDILGLSFAFRYSAIKFSSPLLMRIHFSSSCYDPI